MNNIRDVFISPSYQQPENALPGNVSTEDMFGIVGVFDVPAEHLTEEELRLMLRDMRSIKSNELLRGTKE